VKANYEGVIFYSDGSPLSLPESFLPPPWASDGGEQSAHFSIRPDVSLITEIEDAFNGEIIIKNWNSFCYNDYSAKFFS